MKLSITIFNEIALVRISGTVDSHAAGHLYDGLVKRVREGDRTLIIDLAGVPVMTRAGVRGIIVAARLLQNARGAMRICGANTGVAAFLKGLGFDHLLVCDPTLQASLIALCPDTGRRAAIIAAGLTARAPLQIRNHIHPGGAFSTLASEQPGRAWPAALAVQPGI